MSEKLWIVGELIEWPTFELVGVFGSEELALKECIKDNYFIGYLNKNEAEHRTQQLKGCYYPLLEFKPQ